MYELYVVIKTWPQTLHEHYIHVYTCLLLRNFQQIYTQAVYGSTHRQCVGEYVQGVHVHVHTDTVCRKCVWEYVHMW